MKRLILSVLIVAFALSGFSQKHVRLSFIGSPSIDWMSSNNTLSKSERITLGYDFGLNGDFYQTEDERYALVTGLQISNLGGELTYLTGSDIRFSGTTLPNRSQIKYRLRYLEVPIGIKLRTDQVRRVRYWGMIGMSPMVNISATGFSNNGALYKSKISDEVNPFNLAMNIGIGFDFDLGGNNSVTAGLIFQNGLTDVTTDNVVKDKTVINSLKLKIGMIF
jgi:hypothetical protein